jgi:hypothetical protein
VPAERLSGGPYAFETGFLKGAQRAFRLGDTLKVRISRIEPATNELELKPA